MIRTVRARPGLRQLAVLGATLAALAAFPTLASAASCDYDGAPTMVPDKSLIDSGGFGWDIKASDAAADDGYHAASNRSDAFDQFGGLYVTVDGGTTIKPYANPNTTGCTTEENGREIVFPADTTSITGLSLARKVYVPAAGLAFARWLDSVTNTTDQPITAEVRWGGELGSDNNTKVDTTSNGNADMTEADTWVDTFEDPLGAGSDPTFAMVWDGTSQPALRAAHAGRFDPWTKGYALDPDLDSLGAAYTVVLAPGETKRFMHFAALRLDKPEAAAAARAIAAEPAELETGLSASEQDTIQNWTFDADRDGVKGYADNCPAAANAGQEDLDGDKKGDACDDDVDGDGLSNAVEQALRTDPAKLDSDGDGKNDGADSCPTLAAATDDGCPAPVVVPPRDTAAPVASIAGVSKAVSLKALLAKGLKLKAGTNEPAAFSFEILAAVKGARLAKVGDLVIAAKSLAQGSGSRTVKLTIAKKWRRALSTKSKLTLRTVVTDASGNRTTSSKRLKLRK